MTLLELIRTALREDMPTGDITTESLATAPKWGSARLVAKQDLIVSGSAAFEQTIHTLEPAAKLKWHFDEGDSVIKGQSICTLQGDLVQILKAERVALNFIIHLTGIATMTSQFVKKAAPYGCTILDTRKTTPLYRELEKRAVVHGGGRNHRLNLSSAILIKDNHIAMMGGIRNAVLRTRENSQLPIEVEASTLDQVKECVSLKVNRILLDNMDEATLTQAVALIPAPIEIEASGNMTLSRIESVAKTGVHFISVGALTHSAPSADISLQFDWN